MKTKLKQSTRRIIGAIIVFCLMAILFIGIRAAGKKPFQELTPDEIMAASVRLIPPDVEVALTEADVEQLVDILNDVVIYQGDSSYSEYEGQWVEFTITKQDGTEVSVAAYSPFLVMDGVGYQTKYEPCEELNRFANGLASDE